MVSIVIPCYNEGIKLLSNIEKIREYMKKELNDITYEIIVVDDGSKDDTADICNKLQDEKKIKLISYATNRGKGYAVKLGILNSVGDKIIFMDADLSTDLSAVKNTLKYLNHYDVVIGSRKLPTSILKIKQPLFRRFTGNICPVITNIITPLKIKDTQCGFKGFNGDIGQKLASLQTVDGFCFDVELLYLARLNNFSIKEIGVVWDNDEDSKVNVIKSSIIFIKDLIKIRKNKNFYKGVLK